MTKNSKAAKPKTKIETSEPTDTKAQGEAAFTKAQKAEAAAKEKALKDQTKLDKAMKAEAARAEKERVKAEKLAEREAKKAAAAENPDKVTISREGRGYVKHADVKTVTGRPSVDNDDIVAVTLRGHDLATAYDILAKNGGAKSPKWENLNPGMQRMAIGNVLRGLSKKNGKLLQADDSIIEVAPPLKAAA